ncbi:PAP1-domain-containing protein [Patellaria atrata CBS 101060]|uniref:PAP1-domain-containing protein n=1 Tax=Patellaria atrata CBS 101060 TaxID=1346257 RepID=A0A9P4S826_9PEZI|nr:PAP1-domain-containing protein [Patellaria atrata CBS 101060]
MAGTTTHDPFNPQMYLSPNQQDLLLAALTSNNPNVNTDAYANNARAQQRTSQQPQQQFPVTDNMNNIDDGYFASPEQAYTMTPDLNGDFLDNLDGYLDGGTSFDFSQNDTNGLMIGNLPDGVSKAPSTDENDTSEKRKSPDDGDSEDEADGSVKRREGEDKTAKKPGRKPLTSEPTTKRKAQNRAAQRAFRERKEKHLKDLETKVAELEKASETANHENGLLRAQVERLQTELREYRKRLSLNASAVNRSPPSFSSFATGNGSANNFQFEFPKFGGLPTTQYFGSSKTAEKATSSMAAATTALNGQNSTGRAVSPKSQANGLSTNSPAQNGIFNSPPASHAANSQYGDGQNTARSNSASSRIFQFNSSASNTDSPSNSSVSQFGGPNSSAGTSPEPSHNSPGNGNDKGDAVNEHGYVCHGDSEGEIMFCEKLNMACGNPRNPIPRAMSQSNGTPAPTAAAKTPGADINGIDWFASQNGGDFNPELFGDYRESQSAIVGDGDFTNGFFNEAFSNTLDFSSPINFGGLTPAVSTAQKPNPLEIIEKIQDGVDDEVVPADDMTQMLSCHKIWDKLQNRQDFKEGNLDIDGLCSELRAKARCSESGVVIDNKDVEAALRRLPKGSV